MNLDNVDVLYLDDKNVCRPFLKNRTTIIFFSQKKLFYFTRVFHRNISVLIVIVLNTTKLKTYNLVCDNVG